MPTNQRTEDLSLEPSSLVDHVNTMSTPSLQQFKGNSLQPPVGAQLGATSAAGGSLNVRSAEFQRPMSGSNIDVPTEGQRQISINSKEFMPSRATQDAFNQPRNQLSQSQIKELLDYHQAIAAKISNALKQESKLRFEELIEDASIVIEDEYVEGEIRKICNNTGRANFKQKVEDLKSFVIQKPAPKDDSGQEGGAEKPDNAEMHLKWLLQYILTKKLGA